jgi:hypothetical protein
VYTEPAKIVPSGQVIMTLREQMEPEELARFDRQVEGEHQKLIAIGRQHLELQAFPIRNPDPLPQPRFRKKKAHGLANARGLSGAEIAALQLKEREELARKRAAVTSSAPDTPGTPVEEEDELTLFSTPPRPAGESQGDTTMTLAHRPSPKQPRQQPAPFYHLFPEEPEDSALPPPSTAPPCLEEGVPEGLGKRKRPHTARYKQGVEQGDIDESQEGKKGRMP